LFNFRQRLNENTCRVEVVCSTDIIEDRRRGKVNAVSMGKPEKKIKQSHKKGCQNLSQRSQRAENSFDSLPIEDEEDDEFSCLGEEVKEVFKKQTSKLQGDHKILIESFTAVFAAMVPALARAVAKSVQAIQTKDRSSEANIALFKVDKIEQKMRRNNIRVIGIQEDSDGQPEDLRAKVIKMAKDIDVDLGEGDVIEVYRVGKKQGEEQADSSKNVGPGKGEKKRARPIFCKLKTHEMKEVLWRQKKHLKSKEEKVFLNEDLTPARLAMMRLIRESLPGQNVTTYDGQILVWPKDRRGKKNVAPTVVDTPDDLFAIGLGEEEYNEVIEVIKRQ